MDHGRCDKAEFLRERKCDRLSTITADKHLEDYAVMAQRWAKAGRPRAKDSTPTKQRARRDLSTWTP